MPELRLIIDLESDGVPVAIQPFPLIRTVTVNQEFFASWSQAADNNTTSYHPVENALNSILQALLFTADQPFNLTFNNAGPLSMSANGLVLILGANVNASPTTNAQVNVPGTTATNVTSLAGGT